MNPEGHSARILPGGLVEKTVRNEQRQVLVERAFGNFWMMTDLKRTDNKPVLSNVHLIPEETSQVFPSLANWSTVQDGTQVDIPSFFMRNNRAKDASAQCTLVAIAFKQFGAQLLTSWTTPFTTQFETNKRVEVVHLSITEGWFVSKFLRPLITRSARSNTSPSQQPTTLLHYASENSLVEFKDTLRMHNTLTGYVYLLDGLGRVRFAGSGKASPEEVERVISFAKELTPMLGSESSNKRSRRRK
jgi:ATPase complex subunit ATP10